jgi:hypothetical protein
MAPAFAGEVTTEAATEERSVLDRTEDGIIDASESLADRLNRLSERSEQRAEERQARRAAAQASAEAAAASQATSQPTTQAAPATPEEDFLDRTERRFSNFGARLDRAFSSDDEDRNN